jgi:Peptidase_C39 like family
MPLSPDQIYRVAGFELNFLLASGILSSQYEKARIPKKGTPVYDLNGEILFYRLPLVKNKLELGYADLACNEAMGEPLLGVTIDRSWNEQELLATGVKMAVKQRKGLKYDVVRFVAYSYPKIALQFLTDGKEVIMLELFTWIEVPPASNKDRKPQEPSNFERWSLIEEMPKDVLRRRAKSFKERVDLWENKEFKRLNPAVITSEFFNPRIFAFQRNDTREIHYSENNLDHHICYELRGQQTNVWCVAASVEMILNFYRFEYNQVRLASELGLGTISSPVGLPYADDPLVVTVIENLSSNVLDATMFGIQPWTFYRNEIRANRPLISFIPGHSRTVAGYTEQSLVFFGTTVVLFRGLLVYDPWPPNAGVITRWENFTTQTYRRAYSAVLKHV